MTTMQVQSGVTDECEMESPAIEPSGALSSADQSRAAQGSMELARLRWSDVVVDAPVFFDVLYSEEKPTLRRNVLAWDEVIDPEEMENVVLAFDALRPQEVREFVKRHPHLLEVLDEARFQVNRHFGRGTPIVLEVMRDPEADNDDQLIAYIQSELSVDDALARLEDLDRDWWLDASVAAGDKLCIHLE